MSRAGRYAIDRIEGEGASAIVVLMADADGQVLELPRRTLRALAVEGAVLLVRHGADGHPDWTTATRDTQEEARRRAEAKCRLDALRRTDPGGDVTL